MCVSGQRSLVGCSPCGCKDMDMTKHTHYVYMNDSLFLFLMYQQIC